MSKRWKKWLTLKPGLFLRFYSVPLINALKHEKSKSDTYLNGKAATINIKIMENCDCKRTPIYLKCNKVPLLFAPLLVIPTPQMCLHCQRNGEEKKQQNYYWLYNALKAFIVTLGGPLSILLLFWRLFVGTLAFVLDLLLLVQERHTQILNMH